MAAVLAALGGVAHVGLMLVALLATDVAYQWVANVLAGWFGLTAVLLLAGALQLARRRPSGRILIACGATLPIVLMVTFIGGSLVFAPAALADDPEATVLPVVLALPALVTHIFALVRPTKRWLHGGPHAGRPVGGGPPEEQVGQYQLADPLW